MSPVPPAPSSFTMFVKDFPYQKSCLRPRPDFEKPLTFINAFEGMFKRTRLMNLGGGGGGGFLPIMDYTGRLRPKGVPVSV